MNVVYCISKNWVPYLELQLFCLLYHNPTVENVSILYDSEVGTDLAFYTMLSRLSTNLEGKLPNTVNFQGHAVYKDYPHVRGRFTKTTMYRLLIPDVVPYEKVLYLDSDTLVVDNIEDFYGMFLPNYVAGVVDANISGRHLRTIRYMDSNSYINAGVLLFNLDIIRHNRLQAKWDEMAMNKAFAANDQDIINITCGRSKSIISNQYNSGLSCNMHHTPRIVHFDGPKDPWIDKHPHSSYWYVWNSLYEKFKNEVQPGKES